MPEYPYILRRRPFSPCRIVAAPPTNHPTAVYRIAIPLPDGGEREELVVRGQFRQSKAVLAAVERGDMAPLAPPPKRAQP